MKKINPQICVMKNNKNLIEFIDALHFETGNAWPEIKSSRIKVAISDYSDKSNKPVYKWYNMTIAQIKELLRKANSLTCINDKSVIIAKSVLEKVYEAIKSNLGIEPEELKIVTDGIQEMGLIDESKKCVLLFNDKKILDYTSYSNPSNNKERLTTGCKITYNPAMNYPIIIEIGQGYAIPWKESTGQVKYKNEHDYLVVKKMLSIDDFIDMLEKVITFADSMTSYAIKEYYESTVINFSDKINSTID